MTLIFAPVWSTPQQIANANEGDSISLQVGATLEASFQADGLPILVDNQDGVRITRATVNGANTTFSYASGVVTVNTVLYINDVVRLFIDNFLTFEVHAGQLPSGVTLEQHGLLTGTIDGITGPGTIHYDFLVRGYYEEKIIGDRRFQWDVVPTITPVQWAMVYPPIIVAGNDISAGSAVLSLNVPIYSLGAVRVGTSFVYQLLLDNPDHLGATIVLSAIPNLTSSSSVFNGVLPPDITFSQTSIGGTVSTSAGAGVYVFRLSVTGVANPPSPLDFVIETVTSTIGLNTPTNTIRWITAPDLGPLPEGQPAYFQLEAIDLLGGTVSYAVSPGKTMPTGLSLTSTGAVTGIIQFSASATISFWGRAVSGLMYADRLFTIDIRQLFSDANYCTVQLQATNAFRAAVQQASNAVSSTVRFRNNDPAFVPDANVLVVRGLRNDNSHLLDRLIFRDNDLRLIAGELHVATASIAGVVYYEVVYRLLYDPLTKAGGYSSDGTVFTASPVQYPENPLIQLRATTIRNLRANLAATYGFESADISRVRLLGVGGGESLPLWMTCPQADGKPLGYTLALVEGYAKPTFGEQMRAELSDSSPIRVGEQLPYDRLFKVAYDGTGTYTRIMNGPLPTAGSLTTTSSGGSSGGSSGSSMQGAVAGRIVALLLEDF